MSDRELQHKNKNKVQSKSLQSSKSNPLNSDIKTCFLILGMHRSGTSALTRALNLAGAELPKNLMGAGAGNKVGHWESTTLIAYHDKLLKELGSSWHDWLALDLKGISINRRDDIKAEVQELIKDEYSDSKIITLKDPRICRFAPFYLEILEETGFAPLPILPFRNPLEVCNSLKIRNGMPKADAALLWLRHILDAEKSTRHIKRVIVSYNQLLNDWENFYKHLKQKFNLHNLHPIRDIKKQTEEFLSPEQRHHTHKTEEILLDPLLRDWIGVAYESLLILEQNPTSQKAYNQLDEIALQFNQACPILDKFYTEIRHERDGEISKLNTALIQAGEIENTLNEALETKKIEVQSLNATNEEIQSKLNETEKNSENQIKEIERLSSELQTTRQKENELTNNLSVINNEIQNLQTTVSDLSSKLGKQEQKTANLTQALEQKDTHLLSEQKNLQKLNKQLHSVNREKDSLRANLKESENIHQMYTNSTSWKITKPIRIIKKMKLMVSEALRIGGGVQPTLRKVISTYQLEGMSGIKRKVRYFKNIQPATQINNPSQPNRIETTHDEQAAKKVVYIQGEGFSVKRHYADWDQIKENDFLKNINNIRNHRKDIEANNKASIIMPTYNREKSVVKAIRSVLDQTYENFELVIIDDGSTDKTKQIIEPFLKDTRIRYIYQTNSGVSAARNLGLELSTGDIIFYLDSDNIWKENFLMTMITFISISKIDIAYSGIEVVDDNDEIMFYRGDEFSWNACLKANYIDINCFAHRRSFIDQGFRHDVTLRRLVDWDFILRVAANTKVSYAPFIGVSYYDGKKGSRITLTEYTNGELPDIMKRIKLKHDDLPKYHINNDYEAWLKIQDYSNSLETPGFPKHRVRFFPDYRVNNHYQTLLYKEWKDIDIEPGNIDDCLSLLSSNYHPKNIVFHLHWTTPIVAPAKSSSEAEQLVDQFLAKAEKFCKEGGRIFWTIHNIVSHEPKHKEQEIRLCKGLCDLAEKIHLHSEIAIQQISKFYQLPEHKVLLADHGNYLGVFEDKISKSEARKKLSIDQESIVFLLFGQLRSYKGLDNLVEAYEEIAKKSIKPCWLIMAGKPLHINLEAFKERLSQIPNIHLRAEYIPDDEVQTFMRAADIAVLPYENILTSGSVHLAFSFGLPVIVPNIDTLSDLIVDGENGLIYDKSNKEALQLSMNRYLDLDKSKRETMSLFANETALSHPWEPTSKKLQLFLKGVDFGQEEHFIIQGQKRSAFIRYGEKPTHEANCSAIILHYNNFDDTKRCAQSVRNQNENISMIIVSNNEDITDAYKLSNEFPEATIVQNEGNLGYAAGNNLGLKLCQKAGCEFFWILNPDIEIPNGYYRKLITKVKQHPESSFYGSLISFGFQKDKIWFGGGNVNLDNDSITTHRQIGNDVSDAPSEHFTCDYITGANIFGRMEVLDEIGFIPEEYFLYFEETDWCMRLQKIGKPPMVFPDLLLYHYKRSEADGLPKPYYLYYFCRNAFLFGNRYAPERREEWEKAIQSFADNWLTKIKARAPERYLEFERLVTRAFEAGKSGKTGNDKIHLEI